MAACNVIEPSTRTIMDVYGEMSDDKPHEEEEQLQALIDASPLALVEFGLDTRIRLWNPAAERTAPTPHPRCSAGPPLLSLNRKPADT